MNFERHAIVRDGVIIPIKVDMPALALMISGVSGLCLACIVLCALHFLPSSESDGPRREPDPLVLVVKSLVESSLVVVSLIVILAGWNMSRLRHYKLAVWGSLLAMIPCLGPCFGLALPIGVWSLVVLARDDVRAAFR